MKTFEQFKEKEKRILVYKSYFPGENDRIAEITEEEYEILHPHENQLSMGNSPDGLFDLVWEDIYQKNVKTFEQYTNDQDYKIYYEKWKKGGFSENFMAYNMYKDGKLVAGISNEGNDKKNVIIGHIENFSEERGLAIKLIFRLLDMGIVLETGKPDYNSISTRAYEMNKKIVKIIDDSNGKYKYTILGNANNEGKEDYGPYIEVSGKNTKSDNYHYKFEKI